MGKTAIQHETAYKRAASKQYLKKSHKFGIRVPKTIEEALEIDRATKTTFWRRNP